MRYNQKKKQLHISVGELLWTERKNDSPGLNIDNRLELGVLAHQYRVDSQIERYNGYKSEVRLNKIILVDDHEIHLHGRADGIYETSNITYIEEIKSVFISDFAPFSESHRMQCAIYTWIYQSITGKTSRGLISQVGILNQQFKEEELAADLLSIESLVIKRVTLVLKWFINETRRLDNRKKLIEKIKWPYSSWREGQEEIWNSIQKTVSSRRNLMVEASTGSGKSAPVLVSALKSAVAGNLRLAFATSRTAQQKDRIDLLLASAPEKALGRVVLIGSRKNLNQSQFLDKTELEINNSLKFSLFEPPEWFEKILNKFNLFTPELIIELAKKNNVPPSFLQSELIKRADIIIGDQNIIANPLFTPSGWFKNNIIERKIVLIVDEAHGLPSRLRNSLSSTISLAKIKQLISDIDFHEIELGDELLVEEAIVHLKDFQRELKEILVNDKPELTNEYELFDLRHSTLGIILQKCILVLKNLQIRIAFQRTETLDSIFRSILLFENPDSWAVFLNRLNRSLCFELMDCSYIYRERWKQCHSVIIFSATLSPAEFYLEELGLKNERTDKLYLPDIYSRDQRLILRYTGINTAYTQRQEYNTDLTLLIQELSDITSGRWLVFLPSYSYLSEVELNLKLKGIPSISFAPGTPFILFEKMLNQNNGKKIILMVLGGALSEGSDLGKLSFDGVAVVGPGIAPASPLNELLAIHWDNEDNNGFSKSYLIPALTKVIQSVGRLIRNHHQRGIVLLIGQRYRRPDIEACLPETWRESEFIENLEDLSEKITNWL